MLFQKNISKIGMILIIFSTTYVAGMLKLSKLKKAVIIPQRLYASKLPKAPEQIDWAERLKVVEKDIEVIRNSKYIFAKKLECLEDMMYEPQTAATKEFDRLDRKLVTLDKIICYLQALKIINDMGNWEEFKYVSQEIISAALHEVHKEKLSNRLPRALYHVKKYIEQEIARDDIPSAKRSLLELIQKMGVELLLDVPLCKIFMSAAEEDKSGRANHISEGITQILLRRFEIQNQVKNYVVTYFTDSQGNRRYRITKKE